MNSSQNRSKSKSQYGTRENPIYLSNNENRPATGKGAVAGTSGVKKNENRPAAGKGAAKRKASGAKNNPNSKRTRSNSTHRRPSAFPVTPAKRNAAERGPTLRKIPLRKDVRQYNFGPVENNLELQQQAVQSFAAATGIPANIVSNKIVPHVPYYGLSRVHKHGLQYYPGRSDKKKIIWYTRLAEQPFHQDECIKRIERLYHNANHIPTKTNRRKQIYNILKNHCIFIGRKYNGNSKWAINNVWNNSSDWLGYGRIWYLLGGENSLHAFFIQHDIPVNRVRMFYEDMIAIGALARQDYYKSKNISTRNEPTPNQILSENNPQLNMHDPRFSYFPRLPTKRRQVKRS